MDRAFLSFIQEEMFQFNFQSNFIRPSKMIKNAIKRRGRFFPNKLNKNMQKNRNEMFFIFPAMTSLKPNSKYCNL